MDCISRLAQAMRSCTSCPLSRGRTQVVVGDYGPVGGICFIGEAPGRDEDIQGRPFVGRSGRLLDRMLAHIGMDRSEVSVLNIVKCRPPGNRDPTPQESEICSTLWLKPQLKELQPTLIVTLGRVALQHFFPREYITRAKGKIHYLEDGTKLLPLYHPSYVLRNGTRMEIEYEEDFRMLKNIFQANNVGKNEQKGTQTTLDDFF